MITTRTESEDQVNYGRIRLRPSTQRFLRRMWARQFRLRTWRFYNVEWPALLQAHKDCNDPACTEYEVHAGLHDAV